LPTPSGGENDAESDWCFKANNVFQIAIAMCLYHEFAHVRQRHFDAHDRADTPEARARAIELAPENWTVG
jgi:hypothetical protein